MLINIFSIIAVRQEYCISKFKFKFILFYNIYNILYSYVAPGTLLIMLNETNPSLNKYAFLLDYDKPFDSCCEHFLPLYGKTFAWFKYIFTISTNGHIQLWSIF